MHTTWAFSELSHARKTGLTVAVEQAEPLFVPGARSAGKQRAISWCVLAHPATFQETRWKGALSEAEADILTLRENPGSTVKYTKLLDIWVHQCTRKSPKKGKKERAPYRYTCVPVCCGTVCVGGCAFPCACVDRAEVKLFR